MKNINLIDYKSIDFLIKTIIKQNDVSFKKITPNEMINLTKKFFQNLSDKEIFKWVYLYFWDKDYKVENKIQFHSLYDFNLQKAQTSRDFLFNIVKRRIKNKSFYLEWNKLKEDIFWKK